VKKANLHNLPHKQDKQGCIQGWHHWYHQY